MGGSYENLQAVSRPSNIQGIKAGDGNISRDVGHNRRALSEIDKNILVAPCRAVHKRGVLAEKNTARACNKNPVIPVHRPVTRKFAAQLAEKEQQPSHEKQVEPIIEPDFINLDVDEYGVPINVQHTEAMLVEIDPMDMEFEMEDMDSQDKKNPLAVSEYIDDIYAHYKKTENLSCVPPNYMEQQADINERMRSILVDWLIEVHYKFELMEETLFLTVNLIDRFLAVHAVVRKNLQLVGVTALLLACKYEEVSVPVVEDLVVISDRAYNRKEVLDMEKLMVNTLQFNLSTPTAYVFMMRFLKAAQAEKKLELLSFFLIELCLVEYEMIRFPPSLLATAAVFTAQSTLSGREEWSITSERHSSYTKEQLLECAKLMVNFHGKAGTGKLNGVQKKYSTSKYGYIARVEPAVFLMDS